VVDGEKGAPTEDRHGLLIETGITGKLKLSLY